MPSRSCPSASAPGRGRTLPSCVASPGVAGLLLQVDGHDAGFARVPCGRRRGGAADHRRATGASPQRTRAPSAGRRSSIMCASEPARERYSLRSAWIIRAARALYESQGFPRSANVAGLLLARPADRRPTAVVMRLQSHLTESGGVRARRMVTIWASPASSIARMVWPSSRAARRDVAQRLVAAAGARSGFRRASCARA